MIELNEIHPYGFDIPKGDYTFDLIGYKRSVLLDVLINAIMKHTFLILNSILKSFTDAGTS